MVEKIRSPEEINERLVEISPLILPEGLALYYAALDELNEQDVNARSMPQQMFNQLVENVQAVKGLESVPLCVRVKDRIEIISGHHRVRAVREAGVSHILVMLYGGLSTSRIKSKQLAHNTIAGQDDPELIARIWEEITEVQARFEAYVDPRLLTETAKPASFKQVDVDFGALSKMILIAFLPIQHMDFEAAVEAIMPKSEVDQIYLADRKIYDAWREAFQQVRDDMDIVALPTALAAMARLAVKALEVEKLESQGNND